MANILIVDDEPRIVLLLQSLLKANGFTVQTARDGATALDVIRAGGIDITVTDLRMTPMDGMALFQEIQKIYPDMPVILLTAYASVETAIDAMKSGIFDYLTKPFKVADMLACLKRFSGVRIMQGIDQRNINSVDLRMIQHLFIIVI